MWSKSLRHEIPVSILVQSLALSHTIRAKHLQAIVENSYKANDEYFLRYMLRGQSAGQFLLKAAVAGYIELLSALHGRNPQEKLKSSQSMIHDHLLHFPVLLMDNVLISLGTLLLY